LVPDLSVEAQVTVGGADLHHRCPNRRILHHRGSVEVLLKARNIVVDVDDFDFDVGNVGQGRDAVVLGGDHQRVTGSRLAIQGLGGGDGTRLGIDPKLAHVV